MTLCDTGPLVALVDRDDAHHARCTAALGKLPPKPLLTTWACRAEAMHLLGRVGGLLAQEGLWGYVASGLLELHTPAPDGWKRMRTLMRRYGDAPMDLADASLVTAAEDSGLRRVFTLDRHFWAYRTDSGESFEIVP